MRKQFDRGTGFSPNYDVDNRAVNDGPTIVETRGYMTLRQQIERALAAGILQERWRREHFPPDIDIPDDFMPPDYAPDEQDLYAEYQLIIDGRTRAQARLEHAERLKAEEAEAEAQEPPAEAGGAA